MLAIVGLIVYELITKSALSWHAFGLKFFFRSEWDPVNDQFGALPFVYGTIVSSILALVDRGSAGGRSRRVYHRDVPALAAGAAGVYHGIAGCDPQRDLRTVGDLRAGAVVAGVCRAVAGELSWAGPDCLKALPYGIGMLAAGIILAIMVVPIISSITREVMTAVPQQQREAVLALGATRWEMIRTACCAMRAPELWAA